MKNSIKSQPIHGVIDEMATTFESIGFRNAFGDDITRIFANPNSKKQYTDLLMSMTSEESDREVILEQIDNSLKSTRGMDLFGGSVSEEGLDFASTPGSNIATKALDGLTPITILGYNALSHMTEVFKTITHKDKRLTLNFKVDYVIGSEETDMTNAKTLPAAIRDGSIAGMADAKVVSVLAAGNDNCEDDGYVLVGKSGNLLVETGVDPRDWSLNGGMQIDSVHFDHRDDQSAASNTKQVTAVYARADELQGSGRNSAEKMIEVTASHLLEDGTTLVEDSFIVIINQDTGAYRSTGSVAGRITAFRPVIKLLNNTNAADTLRTGKKEFDVNLWTKPRKTMSQPLGEDGAMEDFQTSEVGSGVSAAIKYATNNFTVAFAGINDNEQEIMLKDKIDSSIADPTYLTKFPVAPKLGGYVGSESFNMALRGSGGDRPNSWYEEGIKDTVLGMLINAEAETEFRNDTDREWVILGFENNVRRFVDVKYQSDVKSGGSSTRFGFVKEGLYSYSDNFDRRVKLIGTRDIRHKNWGGAVYGFMKSNDWKRQPTGVYFGHSFKVVRGRDPRNLAIDAILFWAQDYWEIMAMSGFKFTLTNNDVNLYAQITA